MIQTKSEGMSTYGPYSDGRNVFDAVHKTADGRFFHQSGYQSGTAPKLDHEISRDRVAFLAGCQGGAGLAEWLK